MQQQAWGSRILDKIVDCVIYGGLLTTLIWSILKGLGYINTPLIVQQLPVITGILSVLGIAYKAGRFVEGVERRFAQNDLRFTHVESKLAHIDKDLEFLKQRA